MRDDKQRKPAWYAEGLRFECTRCGDCCRGEPGFVWVSNAEIKQIAADLSTDPKEFKRRFCRKVANRISLVELPNGDCIFWKGECTIYEVRPKQCRTFPFWRHNVETEGSWHHVCTRCPGCGKGTLHSYDEIDKILRS